MKKSIAIIIALVMLMSLLPMGMVSADGPITVTSSVANGAMVVSTDKVTLTFSEAIDPETLATGISFSGGEITPVVQEDSDNTVVEVTIPQVDVIGNHTLTVGTAVTGAEEDTIFTYNVVNLLFDMEISGTNNQPVTSVNATEATRHNILTKDEETGEKWEFGITAAHNTQEWTPTYRYKDGIKYLTFRRGDNVNSKFARVVVPMDPALGIANKDALTFETWARPNECTNFDGTTYKWAYLASFGRTSHVPWLSEDKNESYANGGYYSHISNASFYLYWRYAAKVNDTYNGIGVLPDVQKLNTANLAHGKNKDMAEGNNNATDGSAYLGDMDEFEDKWAHIVVTREYLGGDKWQSVLYINGNKRTTATVTGCGETDYDETFSNLIIGASVKNDEAFAGDISTFKMYDGVLDAATVRKNYYDSYDKYYYTGDDEITKVLEVKVEDGAIVASSDADAPAPKRLSLLAATKAGNNPPFVPTDPEVVTEDDISYIKFASVEDGVANDVLPRLYYKLNDIEFIDKDEITVTAWARMPYTDEMKSAIADYDKYKNKTTMFSLAGQPTFNRGGTKNLFRVSLIPNNGGTADSTLISAIDNAGIADYDPKAVMGDVATYGDKWTHYAITKTWVGTGGSETKGKYVFKFYVNKGLVSMTEVAVDNRTDWSETAATGQISDGADYIAIGGMGNDNNYSSFFGDIAHFTLYSGELDQEQIGEDYYNTISPFLGSPILNFTMQNGVKLTNANMGNAMEVNVDGVLAYEEEEIPVVFLATYSDEEGTKLSRLSLAEPVLEEGRLIFSTKINGLEVGETKCVKAFVWDKFSNIRPIIAVSCL